MALLRHEILVAVFVTWTGAWSLLTHLAPATRLLGYAFLTGVWFSIITVVIALSSSRSKRVCSPTKFGQTVAFTAHPAWEEEIKWLIQKEQYVRSLIYPSSVAVSDSIDELLEWILRDFVHSWYGHISHSRNFANQIDDVVRDVLVDIGRRLGNQDVAGTTVLRFVPLLTNHLKDFYEAEHAIRGKRLNRNVTESEELDVAIASKYRGGKLHPAASLTFLDTKLLEQEYLRKLVARLVLEILPRSMSQSRAVVCLIREVVSCAVLGPVMEILSDPDTWNRLLEAYGRTVLQDRTTVRKLRDALDVHASPNPKVAEPKNFPKLFPHDDERRFERFIRSIRQCNNLSDARRFRSEVASQLKRESMLEGQDHTYIRRLETGKHILDQKVGMFSSVGRSSNIPSTNLRSHIQSISKRGNASLRELLHDATGLSYFMEYMDRQGLMTLVQFWIVVDGFRNPLESDNHAGSDFANATRSWTISERADIAQISEAYLSKSEIKVSAASYNSIREFLDAGRNASPAQYSRARNAILQAQTSVLEEMQERHFPAFRKSDLFYKLLSSSDTMIALEAPSSRLPANISIKQISPQPLHRADSEMGFLEHGAISQPDLKSSLLASDVLINSRPYRSLDVSTSGPLFEDNVEPEMYATSVHGPGDDPLLMDEKASSRVHVVEAMEAALNTIMADGRQADHMQEAFLDEDNLEPASMKHPEPQINSSDSFPVERKGRPNLASLGLVTTSSRLGVFRDDDLFNDEEKFLEDEHADPDEFPESKEVEDEILEAVPGDLGLAEAISALTIDIDRLIAQESIVDTLTRKAELTNNVVELRVLSKSKSSLQREIRRKELQRQQYTVQESDNSLYGRATIEIKSIMVGKEDDGQEFALYVIEAQRKAAEHLPAASWAVARRYSEFHDLHQRLRHIYPAVRQLEFPRRRLVMKLQREFLHRRRISLERYLRDLLRIPVVCRSRDLRAFLSERPILGNDNMRRDDDRQDIASRIYNSVAEGMDEFIVGNISVLDQLSTAGQNLISAATNQYYSTNAPIDRDGSDFMSAARSKEAQAELDAFENQAIEPFVKPICDIFLEVFELNRSQNWLRGRAVVVVLHQLLGGTVERKIREVLRGLTSDISILKYLTLIKEVMWPGGILQRTKTSRTEAEKKMSCKEAEVVLTTLMPELVGAAVGRANAQAGGRRIFAIVNNRRLNAHLAYKFLDEAVAILFPVSAVRKL